MSNLTIWHNPRCTKSRQTLALIEASGATPTIRLYLEDPPSAAEIEAVASSLELPLISMMRTREPAFKDAGLTKTSDDTNLLAAMAANPVLIERPIVIAGPHAVIGRPPEAVQALL